MDRARSFIQGLPCPAFIKDQEGFYHYVNSAFCELFGLEADKILGRRDAEVLPPQIAAQVALDDKKLLLSKAGRLSTELEVSSEQDKDGGVRHYLILKYSLPGDGQAAIAGIAVDISDRTLMESRLRDEMQRFRIVASHSHDWETWTGPDGSVLFISPACEVITGHSPEQFLLDPKFIHTIIHTDDLPTWKKHYEELESGLGATDFDFRIVRKDGQERWLAHSSHRIYDSAGTFLGVRSSSRDITDRKIMEMRLQHEAFHDPLTGLPNRTLCLDRIAQALERCKRRDNYHYAVIFLDLDRFKTINDSLGHTVGDLLLTRVGKRLQKCVRSLDTVSRIGGDEFVILLEEISSVREAIRIVKRIRNDIQVPFELDGRKVHVSASIGVVLSPAIYDRPEDLLRNANIAMHRAKDKGRNRFKVFHSRLLEDAIKLMNMEMDLRRALDRKEFFIQYQPIYSLEMKTLTGFEALLRWDHPQKGIISPGEFIPIAEDAGLMTPIGLWVLETACKTMALWLRQIPDMRHMTMNVNISSKQLAHPDMVDHISRILKRTGLDPACLKLEIAENVLMDNPELAIIMLKRLKEIDVKLSIDDFGAGYSSLSYLQRFPIDTLKVDQSFVHRVGLDNENREIVRAVIALAHSLGLDVVAEGIEAQEQCSSLVEMRCESGQGFLFSKPVDLEVIQDMLRLAADAQKKN